MNLTCSTSIATKSLIVHQCADHFHASRKCELKHSVICQSKIPVTTNSRRGITLLEFLIALGVVGLLLAIIAPAVLSSRVAAQRMHCSSNLRQLGIAIINYESEYGVYPLGSLHKYQLLPFIDQASLYQIPLDRTSRDPYGKISSVTLDLYLCPNDPSPASHKVGTEATVASTNYAACYGTGIQKDGYNGFFNLGFRSGGVRFPGGFVRAADVVDGLSNTAAMSELLHGDQSWNRLRVVWQTPTSLTASDELDQFAETCEAIPPEPRSYGWRGFPLMRGVPWYLGTPGFGMYNHILPPDRPSCQNASSVTYGAYSAASMHTGGVNLLYGDGHVVFISDSIDRNAWREIGSRISQNIGN